MCFFAATLNCLSAALLACDRVCTFVRYFAGTTLVITHASAPSSDPSTDVSKWSEGSVLKAEDDNMKECGTDDCGGTISDAMSGAVETRGGL